MTTEELIGQTGVGAGTTMILATPDHTTQIIGILTQLLALVLLFINRGNGNKATT